MDEIYMKIPVEASSVADQSDRLIEWPPRIAQCGADKEGPPPVTNRCTRAQLKSQWWDLGWFPKVGDVMWLVDRLIIKWAPKAGRHLCNNVTSTAGLRSKSGGSFSPVEFGESLRSANYLITPPTRTVSRGQIIGCLDTLLCSEYMNISMFIVSLSK